MVKCVIKPTYDSIDGDENNYDEWDYYGRILLKECCDGVIFFVMIFPWIFLKIFFSSLEILEDQVMLELNDI